MNHLNVSVTVAQSPEETIARLEGFLREYAPETELTFTLRAPFDISALNVGLTLHREVTARITPLGADSRGYAIAWQPVEPGPFPALNGTLFIGVNDANAQQSIVTLDGHYHPPLGIAGDVFDAVLGKHIAEASAHDLLDRIAQHIGGAPASEPIATPEAATEPVFSPLSVFA